MIGLSPYMLELHLPLKAFISNLKSQKCIICHLFNIYKNSGMSIVASTECLYINLQASRLSLVVTVSFFCPKCKSYLFVHQEERVSKMLSQVQFCHGHKELRLLLGRQRDLSIYMRRQNLIPFIGISSPVMFYSLMMM